MNKYSMDLANGGIGGPSGLLGWGGDIARMWGLGMQNGLNMANALRDAQMRATLDPSYTAAVWGQNKVAQQQAQNSYTRAYDQGRLDNITHSTAGGMFNPANAWTGQAPIDTNPWQIPSQPMQQNMQQTNPAPRNTSNTVTPNGLNSSGYTNSTQTTTNTPSQAVNTALRQGLANQYGYGV